eukprot:TRINITY_DN8390_c0_g1_i1.p1 TRINITY_DN8390_c0_g1~~TRINITY_DN8390_c0_g1_i1.p1  ORF type:complete len:187 (-),score=15.60 TRINITY_DN8390_c0_g1_i1:522-1082(-)
MMIYSLLCVLILLGAYILYHRNKHLEDGIQLMNKKGVLKDSFLHRFLEHSLLRFPWLSPGRSDHYYQAQERLIRVAGTNLKSMSTAPASLHLWDEKEFPGYQKEDVFFLKHTASISYIWEKEQEPDNRGTKDKKKRPMSYLHAPMMVDHYSQVDDHGPAPTLDLFEFIREHFTAAQLEIHLGRPWR